MGGGTDHFTAVICVLLESVWGHKDWKVRMLQEEQVAKGGVGEGF